MPRKTSDELLATKNAKIATQFVFIPFHRLGSFAQTSWWQHIVAEKECVTRSAGRCPLCGRWRIQTYTRPSPWRVVNFNAISMLPNCQNENWIICEPKCTVCACVSVQKRNRNTTVAFLNLAYSKMVEPLTDAINSIQYTTTCNHHSSPQNLTNTTHAVKVGLYNN